MSRYTVRAEVDLLDGNHRVKGYRIYDLKTKKTIGKLITKSETANEIKEWYNSLSDTEVKIRVRQHRTHPERQEVTTRKEHTCEVCNGKIPAGTRAVLIYSRQAKKDESNNQQTGINYSRYYLHTECESTTKRATSRPR